VRVRCLQPRRSVPTLAPALAPVHQLPTNRRLPCPYVLWVVAPHRPRRVRNYEVPLLRAARVLRPLSLIGLSPNPASSSRLSGKQRNHGQRPLHFPSSASWLVGMLQQLAHGGPNPQLTSERVQTGQQGDVTEKQSQRLECHFGVTGMILFATRYRQPAGGWRAPSFQPNPSELRARLGNKPAL
jgi:hypothetical protein